MTNNGERSVNFTEGGLGGLCLGSALLLDPEEFKVPTVQRAWGAAFQAASTVGASTCGRVLDYWRK